MRLLEAAYAVLTAPITLLTEREWYSDDEIGTHTRLYAESDPGTPCILAQR